MFWEAEASLFNAENFGHLSIVNSCASLFKLT